MALVALEIRAPHHRPSELAVARRMLFECSWRGAMEFRPTESTMDPRTATTSAPQLAIIAGGKASNLHGEDRPPLLPPRGKPTLVWRPRATIATAFGVAIVAFMMWLVTAPSRASMVERLPVDQRVALFQRTLDNLNDLCRGTDRPRDFCKAQAEFLLDFPECGESCTAAARNELMADLARK